MKKLLPLAFILAIATGFMSCAAGDVSSKMSFYHGQTIPDEFFKVTEWSPDRVAFEIRVDFKIVHMYHVLLDENGKPLAEGWFKVIKMGAAYTAVMNPKPGRTFEAGKKYRLCVGSESPEKVFITTSSYPCVSDYEFVLTEK